MVLALAFAPRAWQPASPLVLPAFAPVRQIVPRVSPLFSEVRRAPTGHANCSRPLPAESPSSLLWLDAWLPHPCSRFFHRLNCTLGPACWGQVSWLREECRDCKNSGDRSSRANRILRSLRASASRIIKL